MLTACSSQKPATSSEHTISKPNIWVISDMVDPRDDGPYGNEKSDPDDVAAMASLLLNANRYHIQTIVVGAGGQRNLLDPIPFTQDVLLAAYEHDRVGMNKRFPGFQETVHFEWSSRNKNRLRDNKFHREKNYSDLNQLESIQAFVDYAKNNKVYLLNWGPMTDAAITVKHLLDVGDKKTLSNIVIVSHWTQSYVKGTQENAIRVKVERKESKVANCWVDLAACEYVHDMAQEHPELKFYELGSVGQTGLVENSGRFEPMQDFHNSRLGQIFISAKYKKWPDQSDAASHFVLNPELGVGLSHFNDNGTLNEEIERANIQRFSDASLTIMQDLLNRTKAAHSEPFTKSFMASVFINPYYKWGRYAIYSPYAAPYTVYDSRGKEVASGTLNIGDTALKLPKIEEHGYRVEIDLGGEPLSMKM